MVKKVLAGLVGFSLLTVGSAMAQKRGPMMAVDPAKIQSFCQEVRPLMQKEAQIRSEIRAQLLSGNPSWDLILEKEIESAKLRVEVLKKAQGANLPVMRGYGALRRSCGF